MPDAWTIAADNFTDDDGSLPGIEFSGLEPPSVCSLFNFFKDHGKFISLDPQTWVPNAYVKALERNVPLTELEDPAGLVVTGLAEPFHVCSSMVFETDIVIPDIGIFVFSDSIEFDYQMGPHWNQRNVNAFFRLLVHLKKLAPEAIVDTVTGEGLPDPESFRVAFEQSLSESVQ